MRSITLTTFFYSGQKIYKDFSAVIATVSVYWATSVFSKSISFFLLPLMLQKMSPEEIGLLSLFTSFIGMISLVMGLGLRQALAVEFYHKTSQERREMINDITVIYCVIALPILLVIFSKFFYFNTYFFASKATIVMFLMSLLHCFIAFFTELVNQVCVFRKQTGLLFFMQIIGTLITVLLILAALFWWQAGVTGILLANIAGVSTGLFVGFYWYFKNFLHKYLSLRRLPTIFLSYLCTGIPFLPALLAHWLLGSSNRWLLASYGSLYDVGIYSLVETASSVFYLFVIHPLNVAYLPTMFEQFARNREQLRELDRRNKKIMVLAMVLLFFCAGIGFFFIKPYLCRLVPSCYHQAIPLIILMVVGNIFSMGVCFLNCYSQFLKKQLFLAGSLFVVIGINSMLCILLIPSYHMRGALIALVSSYIIYFLIALFYNQYLHRNNT